MEDRLTAHRTLCTAQSHPTINDGYPVLVVPGMTMKNIQRVQRPSHRHRHATQPLAVSGRSYQFGENGSRKLNPAPGFTRFSCSACAVEPFPNASPRYWSDRVNRLGPTDGAVAAFGVDSSTSRLGVGAG